MGGRGAARTWRREPPPVAVYEQPGAPASLTRNARRVRRVVYNSSSPAGQIAAVESGIAVAVLTPLQRATGPGGAGREAGPAAALDHGSGGAAQQGLGALGRRRCLHEETVRAASAPAPMMLGMSPLTSPQGALAALARSFAQWLAGWGARCSWPRCCRRWRSPSSYRADSRRAGAPSVSRHGAGAALVHAAEPLIAIVVIRIVLVTSHSYGPRSTRWRWWCACWCWNSSRWRGDGGGVALHHPDGGRGGGAAQRRRLGCAGRTGRDPLRAEVLPRAVAGLFCTLMLAAVSSVVALVVAYLSVYGFTSAGFTAYTHTVGGCSRRRCR